LTAARKYIKYIGDKRATNNKSDNIETIAELEKWKHRQGIIDKCHHRFPLRVYHKWKMDFIIESQFFVGFNTFYQKDMFEFIFDRYNFDKIKKH